MTSCFSSTEQLQSIVNILNGYLKLPFSGDSVPGAVLESVISIVRDGEVLNTYDFVDVVNRPQRVGWQVKATKAATPVTWKRAKIENSARLIAESRNSSEATQALGNIILHLCNDHAKASMDFYKLDQIGFARLIIHEDASLTYYEKLLCDKSNPKIFDESKFEWRWSQQKATRKKEQLPALHGFDKETGKKWFAWHGLGENQLHFSGETNWWPDATENKIQFRFPPDRLTLIQFMELLAGLSKV